MVHIGKVSRSVTLMFMSTSDRQFVNKMIFDLQYFQERVLSAQRPYEVLVNQSAPVIAAPRLDILIVTT